MCISMRTWSIMHGSSVAIHDLNPVSEIFKNLQAFCFFNFFLGQGLQRIRRLEGCGDGEFGRLGSVEDNGELKFTRGDQATSGIMMEISGIMSEKSHDDIDGAWRWLERSGDLVLESLRARMTINHQSKRSSRITSEVFLPSLIIFPSIFFKKNWVR